MSGTLILIVGPSGAGKDTLIAGAAEALAGDTRFVFPRRLITRPPEAGGERHVALSPEAFEDAEKAGAFALSWHAHGLAYGIPGTIADDLRAGRNVVVNVSRGVIETARQRFPRVQVVSVAASQEELARRLQERNREDAAEIEARLARSVMFEDQTEGIGRFDNDGAIEDGVARFVTLLRQSVEA